jgi:hypothetical protein
VSRRTALVLLLIVTAAGGAWRGWAASHPSPFQSADEQAYNTLALTLAKHRSYQSRRMRDPLHWPPGAPFVFAAAYKLHPQLTYDPPAPGRAGRVAAAYPAQAVLSTGLIPAAYGVAALAGGPVAGLAAAAAIAGYPPLARGPSTLLSEPLGSLLLALGVLSLSAGVRRGRVGLLACAGALLGFTALTRADLALAPFVLAAIACAMRWRAAGPRAGLVAGGVAAAATVVVVAPWTVYASTHSDRFTPISTGGASNLFIGTYLPGNGTLFGAKRALAAETERRFPALRGHKPHQLPQAKILAAVAARRPGLNRDDALAAAARQNLRDYALDHPLQFAGMMARKLDRLWLHPTRGTHVRPTRAGSALHLILLVAGLAGIVAGLALARPRPPELWLVAALVVYVSIVNAILVSEARHALTVYGLVLAAGAGGWGAIIRDRRRPAGRTAAPDPPATSGTPPGTAPA